MKAKKTLDGITIVLTRADHIKYQVNMSSNILQEHTYIRVIPQGTVDNNLGPERLAGPKALDPNHCNVLIKNKETDLS